MRLLFILILLLTNIIANDLKKLYFTGNCVTCHFIKEKRSAPSIMEVKENYLNAFPKKEDFVRYMSKWILNPSKETSLMSQSIKEFELMPELGYDEYTLREIAKYIYETDFNKQP